MRYNTSVKLLLGLVVVYAAICALVFFTQRRLQYLPTRERPELPHAAPFDQIREVTLRTADGLELGAWHWPARDPGAPNGDITLVAFHGNGGHRGHRLGILRALNATGAGVLMPDYRGYGENAGAPTERGLYLDGEAAVAWARREVGGRLVLLGQSLGGGVATELAARHEPDGLILINAAASLLDIARGAYPWLPVGLLMRDRFEAEARIPAVGCPLLAIHAARDTIVPIELGRRLFEAARGPKEFWEVRDAGHNDLLEVAGAEYVRRIRAFLEGLGGAGQPSADGDAE